MTSRDQDATRAGHTTLHSPDALNYAKKLIRQVCYLAGEPHLRDQSFHVRRLRRALSTNDTLWLFEWLVRAFSFQGISDTVAATFIETHGSPTWSNLVDALADGLSCPKLISHRRFEHCGYVKSQRTCSEPDHLPFCPLPDLPLRNGRLNQMAYSLFLFMRDVCDGDLVAWLKERLRDHRHCGNAPALHLAREAVLEPMRGIYGVADKVLNMTLATLLMAAPRSQKHWVAIGSSMVAVDTLVHNFLHRTGILRAFEAEHAYGPACYSETGCATIIGHVSAAIDARAFNPTFPRDFPRFIQHAIWRYCAQVGLDLCNGNQIDDDLACANKDCSIHSVCRHVPLNYNVLLG